jgi:branched-chain amino acid transport system substrate-binding protein
MKKKSMWTIIIVVVVVIAAVVVYYVTRPPKIARPIKVGIIDCYSGPAAMYCKEALNGFELALNEINKEGVLGTKIEFTTRDTKFKVDIGLRGKRADHERECRPSCRHHK